MRTHHVIITHEDGSSNEAFIDTETMRLLANLLVDRGYILNVLNHSDK